LSKEIKCPWCGERVTPEAKVMQRKVAEVVERRCPRCGKVLAAYLEQDRDFMPKIRTF
jgi:ribosomal protein S27AE